MKAKITVLDAPSNLGLKPPRPNHWPGVWRLPEALRAKGLLERLDAADGGVVKPPAYSTAPDFHTGFRNGPNIAAYSETLASRVASLIQDGRFPLVLGGDCSILLGSMLALRSLGEYGLCFIDGHDDFAYPKSTTNFGRYAAAGLDLSLVAGYGPDELTNIKGLRPYVDTSRIVALGFYDDPADAADYQTEAIHQTNITTLDIHTSRRLGAQSAARLALEHLEQSGINGFWIHLDADVLDQSVMPAVDSPNPKGLLYPELVEILRVLLASDYAVGLELTIYDPELDPDGRYAVELVSAMVQAFRS